MLKSLYIKNYILIDELNLDFDNGFTVFTGETGAGKSIVINALDIVLGSKPQKSVIKEGEEKAFIELTVKLNDDFDFGIFDDYGIDVDDNEIIISAEISNTFRQRVNGVLVNKDFMKNLRERIADIHSQNKTYSYIMPKSHIHLLDGYCGKNHLETLKLYEENFAKLGEIKRRLKSEEEKSENAQERKDFLNFAINELTSADIKDINEDKKIEEETDFLANAEELKELSYSAYYGICDDEGGVNAVISKIQYSLSKLANKDKNTEPFAEEMENCAEILKDLGKSLLNYAERCDTDEERINFLQERANYLNGIKRKYGGSLENALERLEEYQKELNSFEFSEEEINRLKNLENEIDGKLIGLAKNLSENRKKSAEKLSKVVTDELRTLELKNAEFTVKIEECERNLFGCDKVEFYITTNLSSKPAPISDCASGGEISRIVLALKSVFADTDKIETVVFDETDTGISGKASVCVGEKMKEIGKYHQVILITHQALTAAKADNHFYVSKEQTDKTKITVKKLTDEEKVTALARLAGGKVSEETVAFAQSILK